MNEERPPLGEQERALLYFVTEHAPVTVRAVAAQFGQPRRLARTTVLTVMERLRAKGYLVRQRAAGGGAWEYLPKQGKAELMRSLVHEFVEKALGGSTAPLVAYLSDTRRLSEQEKEDLRAVVARLED